MKPLVLILNPRRIEECIESFEGLSVDKCWLTAYSEEQLVPVVANLIQATDYTHYVMASDDLVVSQDALDAVLTALADGHPVVTGWCNFDLTDDPRVGLTKTSLTTELPTHEAYNFYEIDEVLDYPDDLVPTFFAGFVLTGMTRELWLRYPFAVTEYGGQSDYSLCRRLQADGVPIVAPKTARTRHVKELWNTPDREPRKRSLVGLIPSEVRLERQ